MPQLPKARPYPAMAPEPASPKFSVIQKYRLTPYPNHFYIYAVPSHRGALRNVTDAGRDAVDADALLTNGAEADGEVVWS
jgi:hypothetical protein